MQEKTLKLEISHTTSSGKVHYGTLELPASELEQVNWSSRTPCSKQGRMLNIRSLTN